MDAAVDVRDLVKSYGGRRVVDGVSFTVPTASTWALLGANGAGKTTTVEVLEGYRRPDGGTVRVLGLDPVADHDRLVARIGVVLQDGGAYQAATPLELLRLFARYHRDPVPPPELVDRLGLGAIAHARVRTLSGGERKRLDLALALVGRPQLLVLDEPTAGLDPEARRATWDLVRGARDDGATVLLTTHLVDEAERLADRVAVLGRGRVLAAGSPAELVTAHGGSGAVVTAASDPPDLATELATALGRPVVREAAGRWRVDVPAADLPRVLAEVPRWCADRGVPLRGVTAGGARLEDVVVALGAGLTAADGGGGAGAHGTAGAEAQAR